MNNTTKYSDYYQPDNNIFYNKKCSDFVIPKKMSKLSKTNQL